MKIIIGTRGSKLALIQTHYVEGILKKAYPKIETEIKVIKTKGDRIQDKPLHEIQDKGLFVTEIEEQILRGEIHLGVHSMKDMPSKPAEGLLFAKSWKREDPRDVLILREAAELSKLRRGAVIGTGSKRRAFQLLKLRPDIKIVNIRGNVDTRLRKMEEQKLDGIVLAAAGIHRMGLQEKITQYLEPEEMIPAPAQGILALEIRKENQELLEILNTLGDTSSDETGRGERKFLQEIGGDCHVPVGAYCRKIARKSIADEKQQEDNRFQVDAVYGKKEGASLVYGTGVGETPEEAAVLAAKEIRSQMAGTVSLVGGGPGDAGLITVSGLKKIKEADCVIYDRLSPAELLAEVKPDCELIYVGKENNNHTMRQEDMNRLLVEKAMEYEKVVRLKGGDVYVFGRGGEEGIYLKEHGVSFEVIPGISSCIAGLSYAGIPITHRGIAAGFHVVTAHSKTDELADIDFFAMAKSNDTCVFLMGLGKIDEIMQRLLTAGMNADRKAAVISRATLREQQTITGTISDISQKVKAAKTESPALIVVGEVVALREQLNVLEIKGEQGYTKSLWGKRYFVPKVGKEISELSVLLREQGACVEELQVGEICNLEMELTEELLKKQNWIVFTSKNGVDSFFWNQKRQKRDNRSLAAVKFAVVGKKTAHTLENYGFYPDLIAVKQTGEDLCSRLLQLLTPGDFVLYIKAEEANKEFECKLAEQSRLTVKTAYRNQKVVPEDGLVETIRQKAERCDAVFFSCASSVRRTVEVLGGSMPANWSEHGGIISIGPSCSKAICQLGIKKWREAEESSYASMVECVSHAAEKQER